MPSSVEFQGTGSGLEDRVSPPRSDDSIKDEIHAEFGVKPNDHSDALLPISKKEHYETPDLAKTKFDKFFEHSANPILNIVKDMKSNPEKYVARIAASASLTTPTYAGLEYFIQDRNSTEVLVSRAIGLGIALVSAEPINNFRKYWAAKEVPWLGKEKVTKDSSGWEKLKSDTSALAMIHAPMYTLISGIGALAGNRYHSLGEFVRDVALGVGFGLVMHRGYGWWTDLWSKALGADTVLLKDNNLNEKETSNKKLYHQNQNSLQN